MPISSNIAEQIAQLSALECSSLVESILQGLDATDASVDAAWAAEAEARLAAYKAGEIRALPLHEALAKYLPA